MESVNSGDVVLMFKGMAAAMEKNKDYLVNLDSVIGDGDLGLTMAKGFSEAFRFAKENSTLEPGTLFMKAGMQIVKTVPSTMGTLMGTGFMYGGKVVTGKEVLDCEDMRKFLSGFLDGVMKRGKASIGEKTIVDILVPVVEEMKSYQGSDIHEVWNAAVSGSEKGREAEKNMTSQHGKAAVFGEKTRGMADPGSEAVSIMLHAIKDSLQ